MKREARIRRIDRETGAILWVHGLLRRFSRWVFSLTLPPHRLSMRYRRLYLERQTLRHED